MEIRAEVIDGLVEALNDKSELVREAATEALGKLGEEAVPKLIEAVRYDDGYDIYRFVGAARALASIGPDARSAVPPLLRGLRFFPAQKEFSEEASKMRRAAAHALGEICSDTTTTRRKAS
jgi:HEAT repeat protein